MTSARSSSFRAVRSATAVLLLGCFGAGCAGRAALPAIPANVPLEAGVRGAAASNGAYLFVSSANDDAIVRYPLVSGSVAKADALLRPSMQNSSVRGLAVGVNGFVYAAVETPVGRKAIDRIFVYPSGSGGDALPVRTIDLPGPPLGVAVDARGYIYAAIDRGATYAFPPAGSTEPVRHVGGVGRSIALDARGDLYALTERPAENGSVDVFDSRLHMLRSICTGPDRDISIAVDGERLYVAQRSSGGEAKIAWYDAVHNGVCPGRPSGKITSSSSFVPRSIALADGHLFVATGNAVDEFDASRSGPQKPAKASLLLPGPVEVAVGEGAAATQQVVFALRAGTKHIDLPAVGGLTERILMPPFSSKHGTKLRIGVSTAALPSTASGARHADGAAAYAPILETSIAAQGAAQLVNSPGFSIELPATPPQDAAFYLLIFDPTNPMSGWYVGPGTVVGQSVSFDLGSTGTGLTLEYGDTYEFDLYNMGPPGASSAARYRHD